MPEPTITLDGADGVSVTLHESATRAVSRVTGLMGIGDLRESRRVRPQAHGAIDETRYEDGRLIVIEGATWSQVSHAEAYAEFRLISAAMLETLDVGPALLKWTEGGTGIELQRLVRLAAGLDPPIEGGAALLQYQAQFFAEDPRAYSQDENTATGEALTSASGGMTFPVVMPITFTPSDSGEVVVVNAGNRPTPPVFRIYGACLDPQLLLVGTTSRIALTGYISAGDYLEIDVARRTLKMNGVVSALNYLDAANTSWFEIPKGTSTIQLLSGSFDAVARCDAVTRSAYA